MRDRQPLYPSSSNFDLLAARRRGASSGGLRLVATQNPLEYTKSARAASPGSLSYWQKQVDPDALLPEAERVRRAQAANSAYLKQLAHKSAGSWPKEVPEGPPTVEGRGA